jgi:hypothetical protein
MSLVPSGRALITDGGQPPQPIRARSAVRRVLATAWGGSFKARENGRSERQDLGPVGGRRLSLGRAPGPAPLNVLDVALRQAGQLTAQEPPSVALAAAARWLVCQYAAGGPCLLAGVNWRLSGRGGVLLRAGPRR